MSRFVKYRTGVVGKRRIVPNWDRNGRLGNGVNSGFAHVS